MGQEKSDILPGTLNLMVLKTLDAPLERRTQRRLGKNEWHREVADRGRNQPRPGLE